jgi:preprotein translocase subunit YajC
LLHQFLLLLAQSTAPTSQPAPPGVDLLRMAFPFIIILGVFYFLTIRTKKNQARSRDKMLAELKRGVRVQTIGGILGNVVESRDDRVLLKVDESSNTKIWFSRSAIHRVLDEEKAEAK